MTAAVAVLGVKTRAMAAQHQDVSGKGGSLVMEDRQGKEVDAGVQQQPTTISSGRQGDKDSIKKHSQNSSYQIHGSGGIGWEGEVGRTGGGEQQVIPGKEDGTGEEEWH